MAGGGRRSRVEFPLQVHLSLVFLALMVLTGVAMGYLGYRNAVLIISESEEQVLSRAVALSTARMESLFGPAETVVDMLASSDELRAEDQSGRNATIPLLLGGLEASDQITSVFVGYPGGDFILVRRLPNDPDVAKGFDAPEGTAYIVQNVNRDDPGNPRGRFLYLREDQGLIEGREKPDYVSYDPRKRPWFKIATLSVSAIRTSPYLFFTTGEVGTTIARRSTGTGIVIGVDIALSTLNQLMADNRITPGANSILLTEDGGIVAHPDPKAVMVRDKDFGKPMQAVLANLGDQTIEDGFRRFKDEKAERLDIHDLERDLDISFGRVSPKNGSDFILVQTVPRFELLVGANRLLKDGAVWFGILFIVSTGAVLLFARVITNSLRVLRRQTMEIQRFNFGTEQFVKTRVSDISELSDAVYMMQETIQRFLEISSAIAAEEDFDLLMERLLDEIIATTQTEAGIVYLASDDGSRLVPHAGRLDQKRDLIFPVPDVLLEQEQTLLARSIVDENAEGAPATELELEHLGLKGIDAAMDDPPRHLLAAPLFNRSKELVGVLLLLETDEMDQALVRFTEALAGSAAVSVEARQLIVAQKELFESFIQLIAGAIDAKSPYTGGHCERVPELTKMLAAAADKADVGPFAEFTLTPDDWEAIHVASWLHDCGKVTTPEFVVDKATKLETIYDRIHEIRMRIEVIKREIEIAYLKRAMIHGNSDALQAEMKAELDALNDDFAFLADCNVGGEFMSDEAIERIQSIATRTWTRTLDDRLGVSHAEAARMEARPAKPLPAVEPLLSDRPEHLFGRPEAQALPPGNRWGFQMDVPEYLYNRGEIHNLTIRRGTLTDEDRYKINEHIVQTIKMLDALPFPKHLRSVPELAGGHHEKMDGTGYPKRLTRDDMSPVARMMAIADIFEALTAVDRPYKKGKTLSQALRIMMFMAKDAHVDPELFDLFLTSGVYRDYAGKFLRSDQMDSVNPDDYRITPQAAE